MIKYVVAAHMSQKGVEDKAYVLHETTLLPNIRGFGTLVAMIFSPRMHLKRDNGKTRFTSVLTGLGYTKEKGPIFPQHDNIFYLDFALGVEDLNLVRHFFFLQISSNHLNSLLKMHEISLALIVSHSLPTDKPNSLQHRYFVVCPRRCKPKGNFGHKKQR